MVVWLEKEKFSVHLCLATQLGAFDTVVKQMLEDVQERLVYRTHIYIQTDITGYKPAPGDLAYPEKLEMMEVLYVFFNIIKLLLPVRLYFYSTLREIPSA